MISFCTCCRDRLEDLVYTLPANLAQLRPGDEIVVLDYGSPAPIRNWIASTQVDAIMAQQLRFFSVPVTPRWFHAHAKNICHRLAQGTVLVNLDADNYLQPPYLATLYGDWLGTADFLYPTNGNGGFKGRNALRAQVFYALGGYDENFGHGYGYDDIDLMLRAKAAGYRIQGVVIDPASVIGTSEARKLEAQTNGLALKASNNLHMAQSRDNIKHGRWRANQGRAWGVAEICDLAGYSVIPSPPWLLGGGSPTPASDAGAS